MASIGYIKSLLNPLAADMKRLFDLAFEESVSHFRLGDGKKATNADWFRVSSTTAAVANQEFSIVHGMDQIPTTLIPLVDLSVVGSQLVPLVVSRAPDAKRVYLKSASTSAVVTFYLE